MRSPPVPAADPRRLPRKLGATVLAAGLALGLFVALSGLGTGLEELLRLGRNALLSRPASGKVVLVEIDARSIKAYDRWPWPRHLHARAIDALSNAGAAQIAFDTDFSARSTPAEDAALARATAASRSPVILPTFSQAAAQGSSAIVENLPLPELRDAALLGAVNVRPDPDGAVRQFPTGVVTDGVPRPSVAVMLADGAGAERAAHVGQAFPIDGAIDPASIPRYSYVDLLEHRVPAAAIRGRNVLIGATAVEMGDRYSVPGHGMLPGALVQLLATETLIQGSAPISHGAWGPLLLLIVVLGGGLCAASYRSHALLFAGAGLMLLALPLGFEAGHWGTVSVAPALLMLAGAGIATIAARVSQALLAARMIDPETRLANGRALRARQAPAGSSVIILRIANYGDVVNVLGQRRAADLILRTAERLGMMAPGAIHRITAGALGWIAPTGDLDRQAEQVEAGVALFNQPIEIDGRALRLVPAFGLAVAQGDLSDALDRALAAADRAAAKGQRWERHSDDIDRASDWKLTLASELDAAMASGEIWVAYQPKVDMHTDTITCAEALVRWHHPQRGAIPPESLVALVEENGRIADFTLHVLNRALADRDNWARAGVNLGVAVNVSALLPADPHFVGQVRDALAHYPGAAQHLTLEITESATMREGPAVQAALEALVAMGITISIDDYGTGQSTLSYLKALPAREIKIDKGFILQLDTSRSDQLMVRSTIALAHELGYRVVAEGVETAAILAVLREAGCDVAQGWLYGKPMPSAELLNLVMAKAQLAA